MIKGTGLEVKLVVFLYYPNPKDNGNMHTSLTMTAIEYFFCGIQVHMIKSSFSIFWEADTGHVWFLELARSGHWYHHRSNTDPITDAWTYLGFNCCKVSKVNEICWMWRIIRACLFRVHVMTFPTLTFSRALLFHDDCRPGWKYAKSSGATTIAFDQRSKGRRFMRTTRWTYPFENNNNKIILNIRHPEQETEAANPKYPKLRHSEGKLLVIAAPVRDGMHFAKKPADFGSFV